MRRTIACFLLALLALLTVTSLAACGESDPPARAGEASDEPPPGEPAPEGIEGVVVVRAASRNHTEGSVDYDTYPPAGGDHFPVWQNCGAYYEPVVDEMAVHALEHGAVWIAYRDDLPADQVEVIEQLANDESHVLAAPYPDLRAPVVLTAWERQLDLDDVADERFGAFVETYLEGPTTPEPGAPCDGGADSTED